MTKLSEKYWENAVNFHGHACPGLAIGFRAALIAKDVLKIDDNMNDEDVVCLAETDACGVDAIQTLLKTTVGTGSLRIMYKGKNAFSFYNRKNGKSIRIVFKGIDHNIDRLKRIELILNSPSEDMFELKTVKEEFPIKALIHLSQNCAKCGEKTAENALQKIDGKFLCLDCRNE